MRLTSVSDGGVGGPSGGDDGYRDAFGGPGLPPRWSHGNKDGVGTAYSASSRVWYTLFEGYVTEVYYPTIDSPQVRDLQILVTDGSTFFASESHDAVEASVERLCPSLGYRVRRAGPGGRYTLDKHIFSDPHSSCLLTRVRFEGKLDGLLAYVLCASHLGGGGARNNAWVRTSSGRRVLVGEKDGTFLAVAASVPFTRASSGYVGTSDGYTDLADGYRMDWEFDRALDGNVALTGEIDLAAHAEFTVGLAFGKTLHGALSALFQSLSVPYEKQAKRFFEQWDRAARSRRPLDKHATDGGNLYRASYSVLLAHEDKTYQGALIASLAIPWGETRADQSGLGGYHLVWARDMVQCALGLLAAGNASTPARALAYLAVSQNENGSFPQNFWVTGEPYWSGTQLDETAFPILLARRLERDGALGDFDPAPLVTAAARFLVLRGPITGQERWEEASGYSPSTLAVTIAALIAAGSLLRRWGDTASALLLETHADWMRDELEGWTVTHEGTLVPGKPRHFVRLHPAPEGEPVRPGDLERARLRLSSQEPGAESEYPAKEIVDAGFLELVRYGVLRPDDPLIVDSLAVVDATLKVDTPRGPSWRRYNHDGYGQRDDGSAYEGHGRGRAWPLLTGERATYELAAGRDVRGYLRAIEQFSAPTGLIPEQVWDAPDLPAAHLRCGGPTGSAVPLAWAHADYLKLLRSLEDGEVFERVPEVAQRYAEPSRRRFPGQIWSFFYPVRQVRAGETLRVLADAPFRLRASTDNWGSSRDHDATTLPMGVSFVDFPVPPEARAPVRFTFFWPRTARWQGADYHVDVV